MKVVAFIEPPQADVIEKILRRCGLWESTRPPPTGVHNPDADWDGQEPFADEPGELTYVPARRDQRVRSELLKITGGGRRRRVSGPLKVPTRSLARLPRLVRG